MDAVYVDGTAGEGGGQIFRTSITFSLLTGRCVVIDNIRHSRPKPGLLSQHLRVVEGAKAISSSAIVEGNHLGSSRVKFDPNGGEVLAGEYSFSIGTAGSTSLLFQSLVMPLVASRGGPSRLRLEGGTHNAFSPPYDFLDEIFLEKLRVAGLSIESEIIQHGFQPAGGGIVEFNIGNDKFKLPSFTQRDGVRKMSLLARYSNMNRAAVEREAERAARQLQIPRKKVFLEQVRAHGQGGVLMAKLSGLTGGTIVSTVITGKKDRVRVNIQEFVAETNEFIEAGVPICQHLADQLIIPYALSGGGSFLTSMPTSHLRTNIDVVRLFFGTELDIQLSSEGEGTHLVEIKFRTPQSISTEGESDDCVMVVEGADNEDKD